MAPLAGQLWDAARMGGGAEGAKSGVHANKFLLRKSAAVSGVVHGGGGYSCTLLL